MSEDSPGLGLSEVGERLEGQLEYLEEAVRKLERLVENLYLMHDVCPNCLSRMERDEKDEVWRWTCPNCHDIYLVNKKRYSCFGEKEER